MRYGYYEETEKELGTSDKRLSSYSDEGRAHSYQDSVKIRTANVNNTKGVSANAGEKLIQAGGEKVVENATTVAPQVSIPMKVVQTGKKVFDELSQNVKTSSQKQNDKTDTNESLRKEESKAKRIIGAMVMTFVSMLWMFPAMLPTFLGATVAGFVLQFNPKHEDMVISHSHEWFPKNLNMQCDLCMGTGVLIVSQNKVEILCRPCNGQGVVYRCMRSECPYSDWNNWESMGIDINGTCYTEEEVTAHGQLEQTD